MDTKKAAEILIKNRVNEAYYPIGVPMKSECHVIENENGRWVTYHWERGVQTSKKIFESESEAVIAFLEKVARIVSLNEGRDPRLVQAALK